MKSLLNFIALLGSFGSLLLGYVYAASVYRPLPEELATKLAVAGFASLVLAFGADRTENRKLGWLGVGIAIAAYFVFGNVFQS